MIARSPRSAATLRRLLTGGDRRSIAQSHRAYARLRSDPRLVSEIADLASAADPLVSQRSLDLLEKLARERPEWIAPHKRLFIGPLADTDRWEARLQIVRALPLFEWSAGERRRVIRILTRDVMHPQTFAKAWALDSLAAFAQKGSRLRPIVRRHLRNFERSGSKALRRAPGTCASVFRSQPIHRPRLADEFACATSRV